MGKKLSVFLIAMVVVLGISTLAFTAMCGAAGDEDSAKAAQDKSIAVNVGNKVCPVSGEKIDEKTKVTYEYKGKVYNLCCPMCIDEFKKDPEKYIKKIEEEKAKEKR